ncbi:GAP1-N2 domain-containing protein, partial [Actinomadura montaniterrae]
MAWQLHYTSARRGPTGRAGFQFVAETPGLPDGVRAAVTPYMSYRPPPDAPLSPDDAELDRFPVSLLYDRVDGRPLLLRCRYLGRDYSGRYGNFFAHAVVADDDELEGLRPAELWHAPLWTPLPGDGDLGELDDLAPGAALDPESLAAWLAGSGTPGAYGTLARLVDAVAGVLGRGHGRIVLVAADVELIARWIAVVSYSLPVAAAARLSFTTYTADPDGAAQRLVGTTPDVWNAVRHHASHALAVDLRAGLGGGGASRFARTVAACWRDADFPALDALGELALVDGAAPSDPAVLDGAA